MHIRPSGLRALPHSIDSELLSHDDFGKGTASAVAEKVRFCARFERARLPAAPQLVQNE
jgi:hypothetical protein